MKKKIRANQTFWIYWCPTELEYVKSTPSNIICTLCRRFHLIKTQISKKKKTSTQKSTHQWASHSAYMYISIKNIFWHLHSCYLYCMPILSILFLLSSSLNVLVFSYLVTHRIEVSFYLKKNQSSITNLWLKIGLGSPMFLFSWSWCFICHFRNSPNVRRIVTVTRRCLLHMTFHKCD